MTAGAQPLPPEFPPVRWAVLGTANIARWNFLPALGRANGEVVAIGSRRLESAREFAAANQLRAEPCSYSEAIARPDVEAVYVALPNSLHRQWTRAALEQKRVVLCEKPLGSTPAEVEELVRVASSGGRPLFEAFAFPFHDQWRFVAELIAAGEIGELREIQSNFHFLVRDPANIRWDPGLAGGVLNDVGCYPIHLARLLFATEPAAARAVIRTGGLGVDAECQAILDFGEGRRLAFSCGLQRRRDTATRLLGTEGEIRLSDPFHPTAADEVTVTSGGRSQTHRLMPDEPTFAPMLRSINAALAGVHEAEHLATTESLGTARALDLVRSSFVEWP